MKQHQIPRYGLTIFLRCKRAATGIEYGVLAGGAAVAASAVLLALDGNIAVVFDRTEDVLAGPGQGIGLASQGAPLRVIAHQTFADGSEGWSGNAIVRTLDRIGTGLSLSGESRRGAGRETVSRSFDVPAGATRAEISFDMAFVDSWDNEQVKIHLNGAVIGTGTFSWREEAPDIVFVPTTGVTATAEHAFSVQAGTWEEPTRGTDHIHKVHIAVDNPGETLTLGFRTTLDQSQTDESLMIGNVKLRVGP